VSRPIPPWENEDLERAQKPAAGRARIPIVPKPKPPAPRKDPLLAAVIGALSPGSGQLWVGDLRRGLMMFALSFLCGVGYFWGIYDAYQLAIKANHGEFEATDKYVIHAYFTLPTILVVIIVAAAGYAVWREWGLIQHYFATLFAIVGP
jgi:hypothetical protein